jgi:outer membrane receptor protein involved in Fe transport
MKYVGKQYLDNAFQEDRISDSGIQKSPMIDPFTRIDLMLNYRLRNIYYFPEIRFTFKIINLLDEEYETAGYYDSWAGMSYLYPGAERNYYFAVSINL